MTLGSGPDFSIRGHLIAYRASISLDTQEVESTQLRLSSFANLPSDLDLFLGSPGEVENHEDADGEKEEVFDWAHLRSKFATFAALQKLSI